MPVPWIGPKKLLFIPLIVTNRPGFFPPPSNYRDLVAQRALYDPDPVTGFDRSLRAYIHAVSYGRALLDADIADPITLSNLAADEVPTVPAINAHPAAHLYEYTAVVLPDGPHQFGGMAYWGAPTPFTPPRAPNNSKGRARFKLGSQVGVWAMEVLHMVTEFRDLYFTAPHPGFYDEMANATATHPSTYTKLHMGWIDAASVMIKNTVGQSTYDLHALALVHPAPTTRVAAVKVPALGSNRYLIIEARLYVDEWERGVANVQNDGNLNGGIPSSGVVVYEFDPAWPLHLVTSPALQAGGSLVREDYGLRLNVVSAISGGMRIAVTLSEPQNCARLRHELEAAKDRLHGLYNHVTKDRQTELLADVAAKADELIRNGCRL